MSCPDVGLAVAVGAGVGVGVGLGIVVGVIVGSGENELDALGDADGGMLDAEGDAVTLAIGRGEAVADGNALAEADDDGEATNVATGELDDAQADTLIADKATPIVEMRRFHGDT